MSNKNHRLNHLYDNIAQWIEQSKKHEITKVVEIVDQAKSYLIAAETIPEEKVKQFINNLTADLNEFFQHNQAELKSSLYIGLLKENLWKSLADLTDKSQVEWSEIVDDLKHDGLYHAGEYIGFGELICQQCNSEITITHPCEINACYECNGLIFTRKGLKP